MAQVSAESAPQSRSMLPFFIMLVLFTLIVVGALLVAPAALDKALSSDQITPGVA